MSSLPPPSPSPDVESGVPSSPSPPSGQRNLLLSLTNFASSPSTSSASKLSIKEARAHAKSLVWRNGEASLSERKTNVKDMAGLGIGFQLYFRLLDKLFLLFLLLSVLSLPSFLANFSGVSTPLTDIDSLSFALFTLGNQGNCEKGRDSIFGNCNTIDCSDTEKRCLLGAVWTVDDVANMLGGFEVIISFVLIWFVESLLVREVSYFKKTREKMVPSAARYTVMVKGLPPDVEVEEVKRFFSENYDLSRRHPSFPVLGLSEEGCNVISFWATFGVCEVVGLGHFIHSKINLTHVILVEAGFGYFDGTVKDVMNVMVLTFISFCLGYMAKSVVSCYKVGAAVDRATPQEIYEARIKKMKEFMKEGKGNGDKRKVYAAPEENDTDLLAVGDIEDDISDPDPDNNLPKCPWEEFYDEINESYYYYNATSGESVWERPLEFFYNDPQEQDDANANANAKTNNKKLQPLQVSLPVMKRRNHDPDNETHAYASEYVGKWLTEVSLIKNAGRVIRSFREKRSLLDQIEMQRQKVLKFTDLHSVHVKKDEEELEKSKNNPLSAPPSKASTFEKKKNKAWKDLQDLHTKMEDLQWGISNGTNPKHIAESCGAFVTFEHEESKIRCLDDYRFCKSYLVRHFQPSHLRFKRTNHLTGDEEEYKLLVVRAPEPSELMWENLEYAHNTKMFARFKSNMLTFGLLLAAFVMIFVAYQQKAIFEKNLLNFDFCTEELPSIFWGSHENLPEDLTLVRDRSKDNGAGGCPQNYYHLTFANKTIAEKTETQSLPDLFVPANATHSASHMSRAKFENNTGLQLCDGACHPKSGAEDSCPVLATGISSYSCEDYSCSLYTPTYPAACYCYQRMGQEIALNGYGYETYSKLEEEEGDLCYSIFTEYVLARSFAAGATGVIVVVNFVLKELIPKFTANEHHSSSTGEVIGVFMKISIAQIVNTAVSTIAANAKLAWSSSLNPAYDSEIEDNKHADFTKKWYTTVGVSLTLTMFVNALSPHLAQLAGWFVAPLARAWKRRKVVNQKQLNELYEGTRFRMETRFAFIVTTVFVTLLFSAGLPILLPFAAFTLVMTKQFDRYTLLRTTPQPPAYDHRLITAFRSIMKIAVICHICVAIYMLGNANILSTDTVDVLGEARKRRGLSEGETASSLYSRIFQTHVFPLLSVGAVYVGGSVMLKLFNPELIKQAFNIVITGKPPPTRYYAPGYNSTFHSLLTEDQEKQVREKGDLSEVEKAKGYRLNKNNKHLVNRVDKDGNLLLTWEVAKADGLLHTYNMEMNVNYSGEVNFLNSFLATFGGGLATKVSADSTTGKIDFDEHERQMRNMQANMLSKVQVADAMVEKAKEDVRVKVGALVANKWMNKIEIKKQMVTRDAVLDQIKESRGKSVLKAFKFNLAMARLRREKEVVEGELGRYLVERAMESIIDEVVLRGEEEGKKGRVGLLEKMVSAKGQDLEKYKAMYDNDRKKREGSAAISKLKIAAVKEAARVRSEAGKVVWSLVERCVGLNEEKKVEKVVEKVEVVKYVTRGGAVVGEDRAVTEARLMAREVVAGVIFGVVGGIMRDSKTTKEKGHDAPQTPRRIVVNMPQIVVSPPLVRSFNTPATPAPPSPPEEIIKAVMEYMVSNVEVTEYKRQVDYIQASVMFEKEVRKQMRREEKLRLQKEAEERERALLAHTLPSDFFGANFSPVDFYVRSQEDLDRAEVALVFKDMVSEVVEKLENLELRASLKVLEEKVNDSVPKNSPIESPSESTEGSPRGGAPEGFTASLLIAAGAIEESIDEESVKFKARLVEELGKRRKIVLIQRAARGWLARRNEAARIIARVTRSRRVRLLQQKLVLSAKKEQKLAEELEKVKLESVKKSIDFEGMLEEKAESVKAIEQEWKERVGGLERDFFEKELELNEKLKAATELLEEKELKEQHEKLVKEKLAKEKHVLEGLLSAAEEEDELESKVEAIKQATKLELAEARASLEEEKTRLEEEMAKRLKGVEEEAKRKVEDVERDKRRVEEEARMKVEEVERDKRRVEEEARMKVEKSEEVEKKRAETEKRLDETLNILQKKESDLFSKIKEVNETNTLLIDVQKNLSDKEAVTKELRGGVKESIEEAATLKMKLTEAELRLSEMKGRSDELEARVESMKVNSDLKGTFDLLTQQLAAANSERESILSERMKDQEKGRSEIETEIMEQRKEMERVRKEDQEKMDEKVAELMRVVEELRKDKENEAEAVRVAKAEALEKEKEKENEEQGPAMVVEDSFGEFNNVSVNMVDSSVVEEREREIEALQGEVERMKAVMQGHSDTEAQLKKALRRIISMKQKSTQAKGFYEHKIKEAAEEKARTVEELEGVLGEKQEVEVELKAAQEVVMGMEQEADENKAKFTRVLTEIKDREVKVTAARREAERLRKEIEAMKKKEEEKKGDVERQLARLRRQIKEGHGLANQLENKEEVIQDLKLELQREQLARKTAYNTLQDMQGKIRVIVRCRPLVASEREKGSRGIVKLADEVSLQIMGDKGKALEFAFDGVLGSKILQEGVFEKAKGMIGSVIDGFNATIFAYGQTGSGKTYSMAGAAGGGGEEEGIIPRSARELFSMLEARSEFYDYSVSCYFVELYVNKLNDLFLPVTNDKPIHHQPDKLEVKLDASRMVYVKNATVKEIEDSDDLINAWAGGEQLRNVTSTNMNDRSSRSHSVLSVIVETKSKTTGATTRAKLSLIDLAGSERVKKSGVHGVGMQEAQSINKSLTCLSDVISALSNESKFVPYRNNKLTQLMQDSLGGNSKTMMLVAISPAEFNREETIMSLHYASRARLIKNKSVKGQGSIGSLEEVKRLRGIIEEMRREKREREEEEVKGPA
ncbi:hypothetical protein TrST_g4791 [Triparma strigata]|uniref:WW domain-containing protein n=1 Tax=Triparma strigata TaxID=1606541 RepID=A0A9W7EM15_9STRA|nr:hypothetical protein TrST_g4791 [Triparma strigata]